jgi:hypothetical protein
MTQSSYFVFRDEKKHSVRYDAVAAPDVDDIASSIYISKAVLTRPYPTRIKLTFEVTDGN